MLGSRGVFELPLLVPADTYQIIHSTPQTIPDPIFRLAGHSWVVGDRDLLHAGACGMRENGHETMDAVKRRHDFQKRSLKNTQVAAGILEIDSQSNLSGGARNARRNFPQAIVHPA